SSQPAQSSSSDRSTAKRSQGVLVLKEDEVAALVNADDAIAALKEMLAAMAAGQIANVPRRRASVPGFTLHGMAAADSRLRRAAWKQYSTTAAAAKFHVGLYDTASGDLLALLQANRLGQLRTGALSAVAAERLAPAGRVGRVGLIGCGWQAQSQLECLSRLATVESVSVFCRDVQRREKFAQQMSSALNLPVEAADSARSCAAEAETLITMTSARTPVVEAAWLEKCRLIIAAGSNHPRHAELPADVVQRAARIVVDDLESCRAEAGDLLLAAAQLDHPEEDLWQRVETLAGVVAGQTPPAAALAAPSAADGSPAVIFKSVGMAACDLALASLVYDRACQSSVGTRIEL
ncbi:MAG: ornithine cyclodeaminase family protein, partial [Aureliella sp.]